MKKQGYYEKKLLLSTKELDFIKNVVKNKPGLKSLERLTFTQTSMIKKIMSHFDVTTFPQVIKKSAFLGMLQIDDEAYKNKILEKAKADYLDEIMTIRKIVNFFFKSPSSLIRFYDSVFMNYRKKNLCEIKKITEAINKDSDVEQFLMDIKKEFKLTSYKKINQFSFMLYLYFRSSFDNKLIEEINRNSENKILGIFYAVFHYINHYEPMAIQAKLTEEEIELVEYLVNKGDYFEFASLKAKKENLFDIQALCNIIQIFKTDIFIIFECSSLQEVILNTIIDKSNTKYELFATQLLLSQTCKELHATLNCYKKNLNSEEKIHLDNLKNGITLYKKNALWNKVFKNQEELTKIKKQFLLPLTKPIKIKAYEEEDKSHYELVNKIYDSMFFTYGYVLRHMPDELIEEKIRQAAS